MKKIELLAPAGNFDCLKAAINNGADAVYLGGKNFSARAFANNFDNEELIKAIEYAHLRNVRVFVTLNTLLNEFEIDNALKMADFYYENKVDALLIQDLGLYYAIKNKYPDFELHCSTQMHIHNLEGVKTAKKMGFKRVVLARESNLKLIEEVCKEDIEIEVFVHGAICTSYSGQCLMSSFIKNRSANKGMCAQCCRLKYTLLDENNNKVNTDTDYLLSPKDMYLLNDIASLIDAGVDSFKIEGRMKSSAYVGYITRIYRKAIDYYLEKNKPYIPSDQEINNLKVLFNRDFTNDLLYDKNNLYNQKTPNHLGIEIGEVINNKQSFTYIRLDKDLNQFDGIRIGEYGCIVNMLYKDDLLVNSGKKGDIVYLKTDKKLNGKVYKTLDYLLENEINNTLDIKLPLDMTIDILPDYPVKVNLKCRNQYFEYISDVIPEIALKSPITTENIIKQFSKIKDTAYNLNNIDINYEECFVNIKDLNLIRNEAINSFNRYRLDSFKRKEIYGDYSVCDLVNEVYDNILIQEGDYISDGNDDYKINYVINPDSQYVNCYNAVISEAGGLFKEYRNKIAYYTLNCCNSYCYEFLKKIGFKYIILSSELDELMVDKLIEKYKDRNNIDIKPFVLIDGSIPLMYLKNNPFEKYMKNDTDYHLNDGVNNYKIRLNKGVIELLSSNISREFNDSKKYLSFIIKS